MKTYRIMAVQEEGSEVCLGSGLSEYSAYKKMEEAREIHEEYRGFSVELEQNYREEYFGDLW